MLFDSFPPSSWSVGDHTQESSVWSDDGVLTAYPKIGWSHWTIMQTTLTEILLIVVVLNAPMEHMKFEFWCFLTVVMTSSQTLAVSKHHLDLISCKQAVRLISPLKTWFCYIWVFFFFFKPWGQLWLHHQLTITKYEWRVNNAHVWKITEISSPLLLSISESITTKTITILQEEFVFTCRLSNENGVSGVFNTFLLNFSDNEGHLKKKCQI